MKFTYEPTNSRSVPKVGMNLVLFKDAIDSISIIKSICGRYKYKIATSPGSYLSWESKSYGDSYKFLTIETQVINTVNNKNKYYYLYDKNGYLKLDLLESKWNNGDYLIATPVKTRLQFA